MITGLTHITIHVRDEEAALAFYRDVLGFELHTDAELGPGMRWLSVHAPGRRDLEIVLFRPSAWLDDPEGLAIAEMVIGRQPMLILASDDIEADHARLSEAGVRIDTPLRDLPWGRDFVFRDLYGNAINLVQARE